MHGEGVTHARRVHVAPAHHRTTGADQPARKLFESQFQLRVGLVGSHAIGVLHVVGTDVPYTRGPLNELLFDIGRRFIASPAGFEGRAAAGAQGCVPYGVSVADGRMDVLGGKSQDLGHLHSHGRPASADVRRTFNQAHGSVGIDTGGGASRPGSVEPEPGGDAPTPVRALQGSLVVLGIHSCRQCFQIAHFL